MNGKNCAMSWLKPTKIPPEAKPFKKSQGRDLTARSNNCQKDHEKVVSAIIPSRLHRRRLQFVSAPEFAPGSCVCVGQQNPSTASFPARLGKTGHIVTATHHPRDIEQVRGRDRDGVMQTLLERDLS